MIGGFLALLFLSGLITHNVDVRQLMTESRDLVPWLATIVFVIVVQCGIVAGVCSSALRKFSALD